MRENVKNQTSNNRLGTPTTYVMKGKFDSNTVSSMTTIPEVVVDEYQRRCWPLPEIPTSYGKQLFPVVKPYNRGESGLSEKQTQPSELEAGVTPMDRFTGSVSSNSEIRSNNHTASTGFFIMNVTFETTISQDICITHVIFMLKKH